MEPEGSLPCSPEPANPEVQCKPRHSQEDNIGKDLKEMGWKSVDWIHVAQNRG
jgi:hypothetical protein